MCRTTCMETIAQDARERRDGNEPTVVVRYGK